MAREALFNILQNRLDFGSIRMLDLFGGTGAHSLEAISRGCPNVVYVDQHGPCHAFVRAMAKELDVEASLQLHRVDVFRFLERCTPPLFEYIFADPPFQLPQLSQLPDVILNSGCLAPEGLLVLEHGPVHRFDDHTNFQETRRYGQVHFSFFHFTQTDHI
jgi:16S rRNA (guanine966-N2)-methyltransferase